MAWKYVNPGYGELLASPVGTTYDKKYNPINGVSIKNCPNSNIIIPSSKEIWIKMGFVGDNTGYQVSGGLYIDASDSKRTGLWISNLYEFHLFNNGQQVADMTNQISLGANSYNTFLMHIKSDINNGVIETFVNDEPLLTYNGNVYNGASFTKLSAWSYTYSYVSNIIASDTDISNEQVAIAKLKDLSGTWDGIMDGTPTATDINQILTQKIDTDDLKSQMASYSTEPTITSITLGAMGIRYSPEKVNAINSYIKHGERELFSNTRNINSNSTLSLETYVGNISVDAISDITLNLKSVRK